MNNMEKLFGKFKVLAVVTDAPTTICKGFGDGSHWVSKQTFEWSLPDNQRDELMEALYNPETEKLVGVPERFFIAHEREHGSLRGCVAEYGFITITTQPRVEDLEEDVIID